MKELIYRQLYLPGVEQHGSVTAMVDGAYTSDLATHFERVQRTCSMLADELGVAPSDRFAVLALNSHQFVELWHAAFMGCRASSIR